MPANRNPSSTDDDFLLPDELQQFANGLQNQADDLSSVYPAPICRVTNEVVQLAAESTRRAKRVRRRILAVGGSIIAVLAVCLVAPLHALLDTTVLDTGKRVVNGAASVSQHVASLNQDVVADKYAASIQNNPDRDVFENAPSTARTPDIIVDDIFDDATLVHLETPTTEHAVFLKHVSEPELEVLYDAWEEQNNEPVKISI